jgi:hypothetical protein
LAVETSDGDTVALSGVPVWVGTRVEDPDGRPVSEHAQRHEALAAYRAALVNKVSE